MPSLEATFANGHRQTIELSRTAPLTIGSQAFNDLTISDEEVAAMHCRIGWSKSGYEVTAATNRGVDLNGTVVQHAMLKSGDTLRIGSCDLTFQDETATGTTLRKERDPRGAETKQAPKAAGKQVPSSAPDKDLEDLSVFEGPVRTDSDPESPLSADGWEELLDEPKAPPAATATPQGGIRRELQGGRRRPGEQEILKSPLILSLMGGSVLLLLIAGTLWFLLGRESATKLYAQGEQDLSAARYSQAIEVFDEYIRRYPRSQRTFTARVLSGKARVQRELTGATPAWGLAWERLQGFVQEFRNDEGYQELLPTVREFAEEIAMGAARSAELGRDPALLPISANATQLLERSAGDEDALATILTRIQQATQRAEAAIARQQTRDIAVGKMEAALKANTPVEALAERERLVRTFPEYLADRDVARILQSSLELELSTVEVEELDQPAIAAEEQPPRRQILPLFHARSRTNESSLGQRVWVLAQESCYGVDTITGEVVWRQVIGPDPAFAPVETRGDSPGWLMFDRRHGRLLHVRQDTGQLLWQQAISDTPTGRPRVEEGQIYLATADRKFWRIDEETGRVSARLTFSQPISGPPVADPSGEFLFLTGDRGLIYSLSKRPLECVAVTFTDHASGSVRAPLLTVGRLLLLTENDRLQSTRLRLWNATDPARPLTTEIDLRTPGPVFDSPVLRGPHLVLPLQGERVSAFVIDDATGRAEMTPIGTYRVQDGYNGPLHVVLGPDQQFWLSSTAFRRFEITSDSVRMDPTAVAVGLTSQPLQASVETFFVGRRSPHTEGVQFTNIDRNSLTGSWRTLVGARPRTLTTGSSDNLVFVTDSGTLVNIGRSRWQAGGIETNGVTDLELPPNLTAPLIAGELSDGRLALSATGSPPRLWLIDSAGRVATPIDLPSALEHSPVLLKAGMVWPMSGRLSLRPTSGGNPVEEWQAPVAQEQPPVWVHVLATADDELLAIDSDGQCRRIQLQGGDIPHLAEILSVNLPGVSPVTPLRVGTAVVMVQPEGKLILIDSRTLEPLAQWQAADEILGMALIDSQLLVWDSAALYRLDGDQKLSEVWKLPLEGRRPIGRPVRHGSEVWLGCQAGEVLQLDFQTGQAISNIALPQSLSLGIVKVAGSLWVMACDGTLYWVADLEGAAP